jgi:hypothetical protein
MDNISVYWAEADGGTTDGSRDRWYYTPIKYWPGKVNAAGDYGKVTFFGYNPNDAVNVDVTTTGTAVTPKITFTCPAAVTNQFDLVADMLPDQTSQTVATGKVNFVFDHLLSKIGFNAKLNEFYTGSTVKVKSLTVNYTANKIISQATYNFREDNTANTIWTAVSSNFMSGSDNIFSTGETEVELNNNAAGANAYTVAKQIHADNKFLMLIPQAAYADGDITATLIYTITTGDAISEYTIIAKLPVIAGGWLPGKQYTYTFNLTLSPVIFDTDISVNNWLNGTQPGTIEI